MRLKDILNHLFSFEKVILFALGISNGRSCVLWFVPDFFSHLFLIYHNPKTIFNIPALLPSDLTTMFFGFFNLVMLYALIKFWNIDNPHEALRVFLFGSASVSLFYAFKNVTDVSALYVTEVDVGPFIVGGYTFPAIYTFKIFRSLFFSSFFTVIERIVEYLGD
jgi:hypothetical protein